MTTTDHATLDPALASLDAPGAFRPGSPGSHTDLMGRAVIHTDVIASGLLTFGQHIELQWQVS